MDDEDLIAAIVAELEPIRDYNMETAPGREDTQTLRTMAQGATLGGADEIEAAVRSIMPNVTYDTALEDVRAKVEDYRRKYPGKALVDEVTGAAVPALLGLFTGGSGTAATVGRNAPLWARGAKLAGVGAVEGGAYGFMSGTGGDAETYWGQALNRAPDALIGAGTGLMAAPVAGAAATGAGRSLSAMLDYANRKFGPRIGKAAERELKRVIDESGLTMDEAVRKIESGELLAEANKTLQSVARGYYAKDTGAAQILSDTFSTRPDALRRETMDYLQENLTEGADPNVLRQFQADDATLRAQKGADYDAAFSEAGPLSNDAVSQLADAYKRVPGAAQELDVMFRAKTGRTPFFKMEQDGTVTMTRKPSVEEAEIFYRGIRDYSRSLSSSGKGSGGGAVGEVAQRVKGVVDEASPDVAKVRTEWASLETAKEAFDEGRKALSRSPDEVAIAFEAAGQKGEGVLKAYRAGVMDAYRRKASTGSNKSMPRNMADEERKEGAILRTVFPEDNLEEMLGKAGRAAKSQDASNQILGGSQTAITQGRSSQVGGSMLQDGLEAASGSPVAALRVAGQVLKELRPGMDSKDLQQVAKMMVESDPEAFKRAAIGTGKTDLVVRLADATLQRLEGAAAGTLRRGAQPAQQGLLGQF